MEKHCSNPQFFMRKTTVFFQYDFFLLHNFSFLLIKRKKITKLNSESAQY
jgi:hypothetical protein